MIIARVAANFALLFVCLSSAIAEEKLLHGAISLAEMKKNGWVAFHGKISAVDIRNHTVTVHGKVDHLFLIEPTTKIMRRGKPTSLKDVAVGEEVNGIMGFPSLGKITAVSMNFGSVEGLYPAGIPVPGKPGFVRSPLAPNAGYVDVRGRKKGDEILDPFSKEIFVVP